MKKTITRALLLVLSVAGFVGCNTDSKFSTSQYYTYAPRVIMIDTTSVVGDNAQYRIDTTLINYFEEQKTAGDIVYSGAGRNSNEAFTQIFSALEIDFKKYVSSVSAYDYAAILDECKSFFTGTVDVSYGVHQHLIYDFVMADTVAKNVVIANLQPPVSVK